MQDTHDVPIAVKESNLAFAIESDEEVFSVLGRFKSLVANYFTFSTPYVQQLVIAICGSNTRLNLETVIKQVQEDLGYSDHIRRIGRWANETWYYNDFFGSSNPILFFGNYRQFFQETERVAQIEFLYNPSGNSLAEKFVKSCNEILWGIEEKSLDQIVVELKEEFDRLKIRIIADAVAMFAVPVWAIDSRPYTLKPEEDLAATPFMCELERVFAEMVEKITKRYYEEMLG